MMVESMGLVSSKVRMRRAMKAWRKALLESSYTMFLVIVVRIWIYMSQGMRL